MKRRKKWPNALHFLFSLFLKSNKRSIRVWIVLDPPYRDLSDWDCISSYTVSWGFAMLEWKMDMPMPHYLKKVFNVYVRGKFNQAVGVRVWLEMSLPSHDKVASSNARTDTILIITVRFSQLSRQQYSQCCPSWCLRSHLLGTKGTKRKGAPIPLPGPRHVTLYRIQYSSVRGPGGGKEDYGRIIHWENDFKNVTFDGGTLSEAGGFANNILEWKGLWPSFSHRDSESAVRSRYTLHRSCIRCLDEVVIRSDNGARLPQKKDLPQYNCLGLISHVSKAWPPRGTGFVFSTTLYPWIYNQSLSPDLESGPVELGIEQLREIWVSYLCRWSAWHRSIKAGRTWRDGLCARVRGAIPRPTPLN